MKSQLDRHKELNRIITCYLEFLTLDPWGDCVNISKLSCEHNCGDHSPFLLMVMGRPEYYSVDTSDSPWLSGFSSVWCPCDWDPGRGGVEKKICATSGSSP